MTLFIPRSLLRLWEITGEAGRFQLGGIRVVDLQDGRFQLQATDGRRLVFVHGASLAPSFGAKETFATLEPVANSGTEAVISAADWKTAFRMGSKKVDRIGLVINPDAVTFACADQVLKAKPVEGRFPDANAVLPRTQPLVRIAVTPDLLAGLLDVFAAVKPAGGVTLLWYGPGRPIGLMAHNEDVFLDALLMPLV